MSRVTWGAPSERYFETGVDRGVLYPNSDTAIAWTGLTAVNETTRGGEPRPTYIDGIKIRNLASKEEYEATIEAFAAPREFDLCDGRMEIQKGLIATNQRRKAFGFSYRTRIGNALDGPEHGYKIHLVYNAMAGPSERNHATIGDSTEAETLSWPITTRAPFTSGIRPTAHFVIDTRYTPKGLLAAIENMLYGNEVSEGRLPLISELITMFKDDGPLLRTNLIINPRFQNKSPGLEIRRNLITNPSFRASAGLVEIRRNYIADPRLISASGWMGVGAGGAVNAGVTQIYSPNQAAAVGDTWTVGLDITAPAANDLSGTIGAAGTTGASFGTNVRGATNFTIPKGTTQRIYNTFTLAAGADGLRLLMTITAGSSAGTIIRNVQMEKTSGQWPYFDGGTIDIATGGSMATLGGGTTVTSESIGGYQWNRIQHPSGGFGARYLFPLTNLPPGTNFTTSLIAKNNGTTALTTQFQWCDIAVGTITLQPGEEKEFQFNGSRATYDSTYRFFDIETNASTDVWDLLIREVHIYPTGAVKPGEGLTYSWTGTANASASIAQGQRPSSAGFSGLSFAQFYQLSASEARLAYPTTISAYMAIEGDIGGLRLGMVAGKTYTFSVDGRASAADASEDATYGRVAMIYYKNSSGVYVQTPTGKVPVGTQYGRVSVTVAIPAGATEAFIRLFNGSTKGRFVDWKNMLLEESGIALTYFDGSTPTDAETGWTNTWAGAVDASQSIKKGWQAASNLYAYAPNKGGVMVDPVTGETRLRIRNMGMPSSLWAFHGSAEIAAGAGKMFKGSMEVRQINGTADILLSPRLGIYEAAFKTYASSTISAQTVPADGSWVTLTMPSTVQVPSGLAAGASIRVMLYNAGVTPAGAILEIRNILVEEASELGEYPGPYFDGATPDGDFNFYSWAGAVDNSVSRYNSWN